MKWTGRNGAYYSEGDLVVIRHQSHDWLVSTPDGAYMFSANTLRQAKAIAESTITSEAFSFFESIR